jgi:hypothetical protein
MIIQTQRVKQQVEMKNRRRTQAEITTSPRKKEEDRRGKSEVRKYTYPYISSKKMKTL